MTRFIIVTEYGMKAFLRHWEWAFHEMRRSRVSESWISRNKLYGLIRPVGYGRDRFYAGYCLSTNLTAEGSVVALKQALRQIPHSEGMIHQWNP